MTVLSDLTEQIIAGNPMHRHFLTTSIEGLEQTENLELEAFVAFLQSEGESVESIASAYNRMTADMMREQLYFQKHNRYRHATYEAVAPSVYLDDSYMADYMTGLALTAYFWPQLRELRRFFLESIRQWPHGKRYLEVGPGHGHCLTAAVRESIADSYYGIDISPASCDLTRRVVDYFFDTDAQAVDVITGDFFGDAVPPGPFDSIVVGEVLEHVENPEEFLRRIRQLSTGDTRIHVTTCVNSAAVDHIFLYRTVKEVEDQLDRCGLSIASRKIVPHAGASIDECEARSLPINVAYNLRVG